MVIEILSYQDSVLNPLLKLVVPIVFAVGCFFFFQARKRYGGEFRRIADLLFICGLAAIASSLFRFAGDYIDLWKWGESALFLGYALIAAFVAYLVLGLLKHLGIEV